jgi:hypothetical protein
MRGHDEFTVHGGEISSGVLSNKAGATVGAAGSGSVQAGDGSTIEWTTASDGTVTAVGSAGRQMKIESSSTSAGVVAVQVQFSIAGRGTYLTLDRSIDPASHVVAVQIIGQGAQPEAATLEHREASAHSGSEPEREARLVAGARRGEEAGVDQIGLNVNEVALTMTLSAPTIAATTATGKFGTTPFTWSGQVDLTTNPLTALKGVSGFQSNAFNSVMTKASYFGPACAILAGISNNPTEATARVEHSDGESWGAFLGKAAAWGIAAGIATAVTVGTGGTDLLVVAIAFGAAADASMISDDIDAWDKGAGDGDDGDPSDPDPGPDPTPGDPDPDPKGPDPGDPGDPGDPDPGDPSGPTDPGGPVDTGGPEPEPA